MLASEAREAMTSKTIRVGSLGVGRIADLQCLGYLEHPSAEILGG